MELSLNAGRELVAIPGPSVVPDRVLSAMHRAMPNIYEGELDRPLRRGVRAPARHRPHDRHGFVTIRTGTARGRWRSATRCRGDRVLVLESGRFAVAWGEMAAFSGVHVEVLDGAERGPVDPAAVEARLRADTARDDHGRVRRACRHRPPRCATTSPRSVRAIDAADHPALLMVDCIASMACERVRDGRVGCRRHRRRLAEGADGAARPRVRLGRPAGARRAPQRPACAPATGTGPPAPRTARTTSATAARRRSPTCTGCARRCP